jgi:hypothetical protein
LDPEGVVGDSVMSSMTHTVAVLGVGVDTEVVDAAEATESTVKPRIYSRWTREKRRYI